MKLNVFVMMGSLLVLTIVSVYAYNAYCTANLDGCRTTASGNGWGLFDGYYDLYAKVAEKTDHKFGGFADGRNFSDSAVADKEDGDCSDGDGEARARVTGRDVHGNHHRAEDDAEF